MHARIRGLDHFGQTIIEKMNTLGVETPDSRAQVNFFSRHGLWCFLAAELLLCALMLVIWPRFGVDDSYIFLTYARNLAKSGLFAFNPGEISYGFSSPAYVILLAAASRLTGIAVGVMLSNLLGVVMCGLAAAAAWSLWGEMGERPTSREIITLSILFSGPWFFTVWFVYGMETGLAVLSLLGFLLWLAKLRNGAPRLPWLLLGAASASVLATTRLESGIYIACGIVFMLVTSRSRRQIVDLIVVGAIAAGAEAAWLLFAHHMFGTFMPWTSTARLLYYLPKQFGLDTPAQFYQLGAVGRSLVAAKALARMIFGGPMKFLLVFVPIAAALVLLRMRRVTPESRWMVRLTAAAMALQLIVFAYLFPLAENRHLAPYIAGTWVLISPALASAAGKMGRVARLTALTAVIALWIGGAMQYRFLGAGLAPLHQLAASGLLHPDDRLAAEPIGVVSFEAPVRIVDLGGLTQRDSWPLLMQAREFNTNDAIAWDLGAGANKLLLNADVCRGSGRIFGPYCLIDADVARGLLPHDAAGR
jgi:hypothetical protein